VGHVTVTLNGRNYRLRCGDGEEHRLLALADVVRGKLDGLVRQFGQAGDDRLLAMAALLVADDLFEARAELAALRGDEAGETTPAREPARQRAR